MRAHFILIEQKGASCFWQAVAFHIAGPWFSLWYFQFKGSQVGGAGTDLCPRELCASSGDDGGGVSFSSVRLSVCNRSALCEHQIADLA